jgi:translation initiation factor 1 (eIF-1/SUI1)
MQSPAFLTTLFLTLFSFVSLAQNREERKVAPFDKVELSGSVDVILERGNAEAVRIETQNLDPGKVVTEVQDGTLKVYLEKGTEREYKNIRTKVYVTYRSLSEIDKSGSGNLTVLSDLSAPHFTFKSGGSGNVACKGTIQADQISFQGSGSGNMEVASLQTDLLNLSLSGSGNIEVSSGRAKNANLEFSGSGNIDGFGLSTEVCRVKQSGSGNLNISASETLEVMMNGSGSIHYKGSPNVRKISQSGSGGVRKV